MKVGFIKIEVVDKAKENEAKDSKDYFAFMNEALNEE